MTSSVRWRVGDTGVEIVVDADWAGGYGPEVAYVVVSRDGYSLPAQGLGRDEVAAVLEQARSYHEGARAEIDRAVADFEITHRAA